MTWTLFLTTSEQREIELKIPGTYYTQNLELKEAVVSKIFEPDRLWGPDNVRVHVSRQSVHTSLLCCDLPATNGGRKGLDHVYGLTETINPISFRPITIFPVIQEVVGQRIRPPHPDTHKFNHVVFVLVDPWKYQ